MADIDEKAVLSHGKALAAQDGFTWEIDFNAPREGRASFRGMHFLSEERRQEYLARARAELHEETGPRGEKRPADVIGNGGKVMRIGTGGKPRT